MAAVSLGLQFSTTLVCSVILGCLNVLYLKFDCSLSNVTFPRSSKRLQRLQTTFGIDDSAHQWFQSYLSGRHQYVRRKSVRSTIVYLVCGVPQGSVLGPVLFVLYTVELISLIEHHVVCRRIFTPMTLRYTARVRLLLWMHFHCRSPSASTLRPHHRRTRQPSMDLSPGAHTV